MRGANVVRRRSGTNPGEAADPTGAVNGRQADGGGSGLLAGGAAAGNGPGVPASAGREAELRSNPPASQWTSPGYPGASGGKDGSQAPSAPEASEAPSQGGAQDAPPPGSMVRSAQPQTKQPASSRSRFALVNWRVRWRLAAIIAVPTLTAAVLGALTINQDVNKWQATGRIQHLAQLNSDVVQYSQALEDELNESAAYAATRPDNGAFAAPLKRAQTLTDSAANAVLNDSAGITEGAGYEPATVQNLTAVRADINDLANIRTGVTKTQFPAARIIQDYSGTLIADANTFSAAIGTGANDADLQGNVATLGALLRNENQVAVQRAVLYAALVSPRGTLSATDLAALRQAQEQAKADLIDFKASTSTDTAEQQNYSNTVSGAQVDVAASNENLAEQMATTSPNVPLSAQPQLRPESWNADMTVTIGDTRKVADQLNGAVTNRANELRSNATTDLLVTSLVTLLLLLLVVLVSTIVARSLIRPLRKLRSDALDVAGHRLPEMVRRLSQSEGADEGVEIEPIGVTSTDEIGEVARAFDQVHREAVRLAADEAMLRGNLNAMFINLSRRSQSLIERQLSLIDSLEQSEQDPGRLSSLFRLDHLATRMRRNSENLLVLAGHEVTRRWSQPVPLVDVLRAAISEIEQYERVVLNVQPGIVVVGQAVNDVVHLVAEIVENATTFSPEDTQVYVSGQPLSSGGVLLDITDNGVGISDQEMSHANWRLDNPPVVDVAVSRRMGLFVVGRLAARHGVRVRLRHAQAGGLTALIWLPDTVAAPEVAPPLGRLRRFEADDYGPTPSLSAPDRDSAGPGILGGFPGHGGREDPEVLARRALGPRRPYGPRWPRGPAAPSFTPAANARRAGLPGGSRGCGGSCGRRSRAAGPAGHRGHPGGQQLGAGRQRLGPGQRPGDPATPDRQDGPPQRPSRRCRSATATRPRPPTGRPAAGRPKDDAEPQTDGTRRPEQAARLRRSGPVRPRQARRRRRARSSPSAARTSTAATGRARAARRTARPGPGLGDAADGQVTVPPAGQEQRLPIFDSLESDWFRRSGHDHDRPAAGAGQFGSASRPARGRGRRPPTRAGARLRWWHRPRQEKLLRQGCRDGFRGLTSCQAPSAAAIQEARMRWPKRPPDRRTRPAPAWPASSEACARVAPPHPRSRSHRTR